MAFLFFAPTALCVADPVTGKAEFTAAYNRYQECISKDDTKCALDAAAVTLELGKEIFPAQGKNIANLTANHAVALMKYSKDKSIIYRHLRLALDLNEKAFGADSEEVLILLNYLNAIEIDFDGKDKAKDALWFRINQLSAKLYGGKSVAHAENLMAVSNVMLLGRDYDEKKAVSIAGEAYDIFLNELGEKNPKTAFVTFNLGKYYLAREKNLEAIEYFNKALLGFEGKTGPDNRFGLSTHAFLVVAYENLNQRDAATKHCLAIGSMTPDDPNKEYSPLLKRAPKYPEEALKIRDQGYVVVEYTVDEMGFVIGPKVVEASAGRSLQKASLEAALKFRYAPRFSEGRPVSTDRVKNKFTFILD
ncbi:TonB family protein [Cellvibrio sp. OA-2007]|uniref:TonB family protein n=1 Tax=Cellvibrio sp. OA-2007 TaxID=529823 RepID=UPI0007847584|nr:TonB family protein [Cellvibrio sp. OA-2007]